METLYLNYNELVSRALETFNEGIWPFFQKELQIYYGDKWEETVKPLLRDHRLYNGRIEWDTQALLHILTFKETWGEVFSNKLRISEKNILFELSEARRKLAHPTASVKFNFDEAFRTLDNVQRILKSLSSPQSEAIELYKNEILKLKIKEASSGKLKEPSFHLQSLVNDQSGFIKSRLQGFVGRQKELEEIQAKIDQLFSSGGYLTITGRAGQGKSSIIAYLVNQAQSQHHQVTYHFIPINPGPDHQISLLRNLMGRLILKYDLPEEYILSENRVTLRDYFPKLLEAIVVKGGKEVIYIDGLDQIEIEQSGQRDLSFLPVNPPPNVLFVLGSRPDDTLKPLKLLKPLHEYQLAELSRSDFDLILAKRGIELDQPLADRFYEVAQSTALFLDLVAKELNESSTKANPERIIARISDDPDSIFSLSIERLKRWKDWERITLPLLGFLLTTREPLSVGQLCQLVNAQTAILNEAIKRLGGLLTQDVQGRYLLYHSKFKDYLNRNAKQIDDEYIFSNDDKKEYHRKFIEWCELGGISNIWEDSYGNKSENERRQYARLHYIWHLFVVGNRKRIYEMLSDCEYGPAKIAHFGSAELFLEDINLGNKAATWSWNEDKAFELLPILWRLTLLRYKLIGRVEEYLKNNYETLLMLEHEQEVLNLQNLLVDPADKVKLLLDVSTYLYSQDTRFDEAGQVFLKAYRVAFYENWSNAARALVLNEIAIAKSQAGKEEEAKEVWQRVLALTYSLEKPEREKVTKHVLSNLRKSREIEQLQENTESIPSYDLPQVYNQLFLAYIEFIPDKIDDDLINLFNSDLRRLLVQNLAKIQQWEKAEIIAHSITEIDQKIRALCTLPPALIKVAEPELAEVIWSDLQDLFQSIENESPVVLINLLAELASSFNLAQYPDRANPIWDRAINLAQYFENTNQKIELLSFLIGRLVMVTEEQRALDLLADLQEQTRLIYSERLLMQSRLPAVALAFAKVGQRSVATRLLNELKEQPLEDNSDRSIILSELAVILASHNTWEQAHILWAEAFRLARISIQDAPIVKKSFEENMDGQCSWFDSDKSKMLYDPMEFLARGLMEMKQYEFAELVARTGNLDEILRDLVEVLLEEENLEAAKKLAYSIDNNYLKSYALSGVLDAFISAEEWEEAEIIAADITDETFANCGLPFLVKKLVESGLADKAIHLYPKLKAAIEMVEDEEVLTGIANALIQIGHVNEAETVLASIRTLKPEEGSKKWEKDLANQKIMIMKLKEEVYSAVKQKIDNSINKLIALDDAIEKAVENFEENQIEFQNGTFNFSKEEGIAEALLTLAEELKWVEDDEVVIKLLLKAASYVEYDEWKLEEIALSVSELDIDEVKTVLSKIDNVDTKINILSKIISSQDNSSSFWSIKKLWEDEDNLKYGYRLLSLAKGLIELHPELGWEFYKSFEWADKFFRTLELERLSPKKGVANHK